MKMHELETIVNELRQCGETVLKAADMLGAYYDEAQQMKAAARQAATETPQAAATDEAPQADESETSPLDFTEMRRRLSAYAQAGYGKDVKETIEKYGARKLSELNPEAYGQVLKEIEAIANG